MKWRTTFRLAQGPGESRAGATGTGTLSSLFAECDGMVIPRGKRFMERHARLTSVHYIESGAAKQCFTDDKGGEHILAFLRAGSILGIPFALTGCAPEFDAVSTTECLIRRTSLAQFTESLRGDAEFADHVAVYEADEVLRALTLLAWRSSFTASQRLDSLLALLSTPSQQDQASGSPFTSISLSSTEVATMVDAAPEYVSRLISALEKDGIVRRGSRSHLQVNRVLMRRRVHDVTGTSRGACFRGVCGFDRLTRAILG